MIDDKIPILPKPTNQVLTWLPLAKPPPAWEANNIRAIETTDDFALFFFKFLSIISPFLSIKKSVCLQKYCKRRKICNLTRYHSSSSYDALIFIMNNPVTWVYGKTYLFGPCSKVGIFRLVIFASFHQPLAFCKKLLSYFATS